MQDGGPQNRRKWLDRAEWFFTLLIFFGGLFYLTRPARTDAQLYFRLGSIFVGIVGSIAVQVLKRMK